jgi:hypothetical protein
MATKKNPITDPTGSKAEKRTQREADRIDKKARANLNSRFEKPLETATNAVQGVANAVGSATTNVKNFVNAAESVAHAVKGGSPLVNQDALTSYKQAQGIAEQYGVKEQDVNALLGTDPYKADGNSPEQTLGEAKREQIRIQRQFNAQETRGSKIKLGRKILQNQKEETRLIGDFVDWHTARIDVGAKVVQNQIATTKYNVEQSKLEEAEEFLTQQRIRTDGTIQMTQGIRDEVELKYQRQQARNEGLKVEIEGAINDVEIKRQEMDAFLLQG